MPGLDVQKGLFKNFVTVLVAERFFDLLQMTTKSRQGKLCHQQEK